MQCASSDDLTEQLDRVISRGLSAAREENGLEVATVERRGDPMGDYPSQRRIYTSVAATPTVCDDLVDVPDTGGQRRPHPLIDTR
jgi:hypothetical protein